MKIGAQSTSSSTSRNILDEFPRSALGVTDCELRENKNMQK
jgi:hypothetical protein